VSDNRSCRPGEPHSRTNAGIRVNRWCPPADGRTRVAARDAGPTPGSSGPSPPTNGQATCSTTHTPTPPTTGCRTPAAKSRAVSSDNHPNVHLDPKRSQMSTAQEQANKATITRLIDSQMQQLGAIPA
jgi:hypothetical protein